MKGNGNGKKTFLISLSTATAFSLLLSSSAWADEVYSETATGMVEAAVQAICDSDKSGIFQCTSEKLNPMYIMRKNSLPSMKHAGITV